jgi:hypothetical protein
MRTQTILRALLCSALLSPLAGCVVYEPVPVQSTQSRFEQSWSAAAGAMADQGVSITTQDRGAGVIRGARGGINIQASVRTLADGRIEVRFDSAGNTNSDPNLVHRISDSYDRRMGR